MELHESVAEGSARALHVKRELSRPDDQGFKLKPHRLRVLADFISTDERTGGFETFFFIFRDAALQPVWNFYASLARDKKEQARHVSSPRLHKCFLLLHRPAEGRNTIRKYSH